MPDEKPRKGPHVAKGPRRRGGIESVYRGAYMRSLFEVQFAKQLDARGIPWEYEPERLKGGRYLVDFHLPDRRCWVEVKGRFEPRDDLLLPLVAGRLKQDRGERLFLYMKTRAYRVETGGFEAISHAEFWDALGEAARTDPPDPPETPAAPPDPPTPDIPRPKRRPWEV